MISSPPQIQARQILDIVYPIGIIVEFALNVNPNDIMHGQKWELYGQGKTTVCKDSGTFATLGKSVGAETHTLTTEQMPSHTHIQNKHHHSLLSNNYGNANANGFGNGSGVRGVSGVWTNGGQTNRYYEKDNNNTESQLVEDTIATNQNTGGGQAHNNIQPSIVVLRYQRTA